jgi:hypothetical protein
VIEMHASHGHSPPPASAAERDQRHDTNERRMGLAALITGLFMIVEVAGGIMAGSLALRCRWPGSAFAWHGAQPIGGGPTASTASRW